ncbi:MAG TPA: biotin/lipoyl-containing protein [Desulfomonilaceae bacterium]|nr:biotin/lipoyl-containing protein [Desulfomonilaceae bacterium]
MEYRIRIGQEIHAVQTTPPDDAGLCIMALDGQTRRVTARSISPNHLHVAVDGKGFNLFVVRTAEGTWIWNRGRPRFVQDADAVQTRKTRGPADTASEITPPTPATVIRVLVEVGGTVTKGQPVVVVSAMKMEMTLSAPYEGRVRAVNTVPGAQVSPGEILVEIDPEPEADNE